jgi:predicted Zn-dependent protease
LLSQRGALEEAHDILDRLMDLDPLDPFNQGYLGDLLIREGRTDLALEAFRTALWMKPDYSWAACRLAGLLCHVGQPEEARAILVRSLDVAMEGRLLACLAQVQHRLGERVEAERSYRRALALDPSLWSAEAGLQALQREAGRKRARESTTRPGSRREPSPARGTRPA